MSRPSNQLNIINQKISGLLGPIAIIGMGKSGESVYRLLQNLGLDKSDLITFDQKPNRAFISNWDTLYSLKPKTLFVSPGVPLNSPEIQFLVQTGAVISSEISLASLFLQNELVVGITGSVGKSTTTAALGHALKAEDSTVFVGGNLGTPLANYINDVLFSNRPRAKFVILELSSFQLENISNLKLLYSAVTFLSPNHLERYPDLSSYYKTKLGILKLTSHSCFLNSNGGDLSSFINDNPIENSQLSGKILWTSPEVHPDYPFEKGLLLGEHNRDNLAIVLSVLEALQAPNSCYEMLLTFSGLEHRFERVGEKNSVLFINDSKATSIDSVWTAIHSARSIGRAGRIHLLLGGRDKDLPWSDLAPAKEFNDFQFYFFGECGSLIQKRSGLAGDYFQSLLSALKRAHSLAHPGDAILLSPGGTSLDEFKNFEHRGSFFKEYFEKI